MRFTDQLATRAVQLALIRTIRSRADLVVSGADVPRPARHVVPADDGPVPVYVYRRPAARPAAGPPPVYVNFHGGGFVTRRPDADDHICRALVAETGCVVVNADYDVAPRRRFPVAARQAYAVSEWASRYGIEGGWDGSRVAVGGQGSGANLAASACLQARGGWTVIPLLQILNHPALDLATDPAAKTSRSARPLIRPSLARRLSDAYIPDHGQRRDPLASPGLAPDLAGLAPALVITAEYDLLRDEGDAYAARLRAAGVPVTHHVIRGADHAYTHTGTAAQWQATLALMVDELRKAWSLPC